MRLKFKDLASGAVVTVGTALESNGQGQVEKAPVVEVPPVSKLTGEPVKPIETEDERSARISADAKAKNAAAEKVKQSKPAKDEPFVSPFSKGAQVGNKMGGK